MCRKLVVVNKLSLGNCELGWEAFSILRCRAVFLQDSLNAIPYISKKP